MIQRAHIVHIYARIFFYSLIVVLNWSKGDNIHEKSDKHSFKKIKILDRVQIKIISL